MEFILFRRLKNISIPQKEKEKEKMIKRKSLWERFKSLQFRELLANKSFIKEKNYIFSYMKDIFSDKTFASYCYLYSLDNKNNFDIIDDCFDDDSKDLSTLNINNINDNESIEVDNNIGGRNRSFFNKRKNLNISLSNSTIILDEPKISLMIAPP